MSDCCEQSCGMYTTWYSRGESGMHHHQMGQLYHHGPPMIKTEAGVNSDCMMAVDYAPPIKAGASSAFVWSGGGVSSGGGQDQTAAQPAAVPTGTTGGGGAQGLVHWMSVMAEHMGGGHHDPSHYALPPWNNGGMDAKMSTGDGTVSGHQKTDDRLGHHQSMSQMLYGAGLGPGRSGSSSSSPVGGTNAGSGLLVVPQPLGKGPTKLQPLHAHARKYHCKMCPQTSFNLLYWLTGTSITPCLTEDLD
ncbi:zinc finger protein rotund-like [Battus philenor]|uniref:zinc finger protein rotund-like n=1 Tax=Battus philenor TaxID=42288 RepID=UPI0035D085F7